VRNETRGTVLAEQVEFAGSLWGRFKGLMGRRSLGARSALWLPGTNGIHMFFMRFPIDAVFCDAELRVLGVERGLRPWRTAGRRGAKVVVELAAGAAAGVEPGDRLVLDTMPP
jgi:hypothetical protein